MGKLKEALVSMGYRKVEPNKSLWMKPFGFSTGSVTTKLKFGLNGNSTLKMILIF